MSIFNDIYQMSDFTKLELDSVLPNRLTMTFTKWAWVSFYQIGLDFVLPNGNLFYQMGLDTFYQMGVIWIYQIGCYNLPNWIIFYQIGVKVDFTKWVPIW